MPAVIPVSGYISEQDYLEGEKLAKERHEYVDGQVFAMAGSSKRHNDIAVNMVSLLHGAARGSPCKVNASDVKVRIVDILPALKDEDSCCQTLMSEREKVLGGIDISVVQRPTLRA
ncbi:MAG: Uma2 family endonuclease [Thiofilum sp.]|uniref:Uma2 family endonuclease n=1 Tax=Thiofilum sp. TaxID=2212733 RepID=UPI0025F5994D|nr:Uma2 family endonuclease [Thiofilum sp.]MBK8453721.1 Uma2 family endonuclease [Thiofilum sp.]